MENPDRKPIIIEFNGLPGSGKTTVAKALQNKLESEKVSTLFWYDRKWTIRNPRSMYIYPKYWRIIKDGFRYAKTLNKDDFSYRIVSMVRFIRMYRDYITDRPVDILLIDQGVIQSFISLAHTECLLDSNILTTFISHMHLEDLPLILVNCNVREDISNRRIISRPSNGCRVETMSDSTRKQTLRTQIDNFCFIRDKVKEVCPLAVTVDINTEDTIENSVNCIMSQIFRYYQLSHAL